MELKRHCFKHGDLKPEDIYVCKVKIGNGIRLDCKLCAAEKNAAAYEKRRIKEGRKRNNRWEDGERVCRIHGKLREDQIEVVKQWKNKTGFQMRCKLCCLEADLRANKHANEIGASYRADRYEKEVLKIHSMTALDYDSMMAAQGNVCAICKKPETRAGRTKGTVTRMGVDHCHKTGKVRGLLCHNCNSSLGKLKDDTELMQRAIDYLNYHKDLEDDSRT